MLWVLTGTRPDIIKLAPVLWELDRRELPYLWVHSGQHYDDVMSKSFFDIVVRRRPDFTLPALTASAPAEKLSRIRHGLAELRSDCSLMVVQGDTLTALAGAIFARNRGIPIVHVEAGLRSGDIRTPEELIRISIDNIASLLLASTAYGLTNLEHEELLGKNILVGNTIVETLTSVLQRGRVDLSKHRWADKFILLTMHRTENLANLAAIDELFTALRKLVWCGYQIVFPIHPHTQSVFDASTVAYRGVLATLRPQDYPTFLSMLEAAKLVVTDSGGIQEEAYLLGVPCVTIRPSTERQETVDAHANVLVDIAHTPAAKIETLITTRLSSPRNWGRDAYGNGNAAANIVNAMKTEYGI